MKPKEFYKRSIYLKVDNLIYLIATKIHYGYPDSHTSTIPTFEELYIRLVGYKPTAYGKGRTFFRRREYIYFEDVDMLLKEKVFKDKFPTIDVEEIIKDELYIPTIEDLLKQDVDIVVDYIINHNHIKSDDIKRLMLYR